MATTTLAVCDSGLEIIKEAVEKKGWVQSDIAKNSFPIGGEGQYQGEAISVKTVQKFMGQKDISLKFFQAICTALEIDWEVVSGRKDTATADESQKADGANETNMQNQQGGVVQNVINNSGKVIGTLNVSGTVNL